MKNDLAKTAGQLLLKRNETLAAAESCTGGLFSASITRIPGSSVYFRGSLVVYQLSAKAHFLKIPAMLLKKFRGTSGEIARLMAGRVRKAFKSDWGIGITGIAGPSGATKYAPVGTVYIAVAGEKCKRLEKCKFSGTRTAVQKQACIEALRLLNKALGTGPKGPAANEIL